MLRCLSLLYYFMVYPILLCSSFLRLVFQQVLCRVLVLTASPLHGVVLQGFIWINKLGNDLSVSFGVTE